jgi:hypothetical protein
MKSEKLKFAKGNAKLSKTTAIFSLPAGHTCMGARDCLARKDISFRCYAATSENMFRNVRVSRWRNFDMLRGKSIADMVTLISQSLPRNIKLVRIHSSGDFFSQTYFDAWLQVVRANPSIVFYAYTKALPFWVYRLKELPANFRLIASRGGKFDTLIDQYKLRCAEVVFSESEAKAKGLKIDHDDKLAWQSDKNFALLLHGTQPAGSNAGKQLAQLRKQGVGGYKADYFAHYDKSK